MDAGDFRVSVLVSKRREWLLRGFFRQWRKYGANLRLSLEDWKHPKESVSAFQVDVVGFGAEPKNVLPFDAEFVSLGPQEDYPAERWSDALIKYLQSITTPVVCLMLEDYWLTRAVNTASFRDCFSMMTDNLDRTLRLDLTSDRVEGGKPTIEIGSRGTTDFIMSAPEASYNVSLQAALWNREKLLQILEPGETPWEFELLGTQRLNERLMRGEPFAVLGTRQWPVRYNGVMVRGKFDLDGSWQYPARQFSVEDATELMSGGYCDESETVRGRVS